MVTITVVDLAKVIIYTALLAGFIGSVAGGFLANFFYFLLDVLEHFFPRLKAWPTWAPPKPAAKPAASFDPQYEEFFDTSK